MTQTARPSGTTSNTWSLNGAATAHQCVNDSSDSTYIQRNSSQTGDAYGTLPSVTDPVSSTGHVMNVRHSGADGTGTSTLYLFQGDPGGGGSMIAGFTVDRTLTSITTETYTLISSEADAITNYAGLYWEMTKNGGTHQMLVYDVWFEFPDAPSPPTPRSSVVVVGVSSSSTGG